MPRWIMTLALTIGLTSAAHADAGWGIQFHYDAFEDKTYPLAVMQEQTEGVTLNSANLFMACANEGIAVIFQPERYEINFNNAPIEGRFLGADGPLTLFFIATKLPYFKELRAITGPEAAKLIDIFSSAKAPVPFQVGEKAGTFPAIGFRDVLPIMQDRCSGDTP